MDKQDAQRAFRNAVGTFATGVTIATTKDASGSPVGVTASSFNSVSLDPPLVLWSLARSSHSSEAFSTSGHFAVHVLKASQENLSNRFARSGADKYEGIEWNEGVLGSPVIEEYAALFQCATRNLYDGGDHVIIVGEVMSYDANDVEPLLFHGGRYAERRMRLAAQPRASVDLQEGRFTDDFLTYLIARAHYQLAFPNTRFLQENRISPADYLVLASLSMEESLSEQEILRVLDHTGLQPGADDLEDLVDRKLLDHSAGGFELAEAGRQLFAKTLAFGHSLEEELVAHITPAELADAKRVLKKIIDLSGSDIPMHWRG